MQRAGRPSIENGHHRPSVALDDADAERADVEEAESGGQQNQEVVDEPCRVIEGSRLFRVPVPFALIKRFLVPLNKKP